MRVLDLLGEEVTFCHLVQNVMRNFSGSLEF